MKPLLSVAEELGNPADGVVPAQQEPGDAEIRAALLRHLRRVHRRERDTAYLEELGLCRATVRVDVAVVNGLLHGYEIKSNRDNLRRLLGQVDIYSKVLDRATLVVGEKHLVEAVSLLPHWWEVQLVTIVADRVDLRTYRTGQNNPHRDPRAVVELLWLEDALELLRTRGAARGCRTRRQAWDRICSVYQIDEIANAVRTRLKAKAAT